MIDIVIGIDLGGTNTAYAFVDIKGKLWDNGSIPTQTHEHFDDYLNELFSTINLKLENSNFNLIGIGIGAPNGNYRTGTIDDAANLRWKGKLKIVEKITAHYKVPVKLTNDANAAALGERLFGGAKGLSDFLVVTLGTGLGSGIVVNGNLLYGHDGFAGEVGHIIVRPEGRECGCGRRGCLETYVSATGVKRTTYKMLAKHLNTSCLKDVSFNNLNAAMVAEAANKGDLLALEVFAYTGKMLGEALANVVSITSPKAIFFFGGLSKAGDLLFDPVRETLEKNLLFLYKNKITLQVSELGDDAAVLGAAALIWNDQL
ncbi:ROK family protein [Labilibaculum sp.]|uniref:ROK family protein n=1 Tax=Labilibaculum sp. TaxID=2060723 RepID=UPI00356872D3